MDQTDMEMEEQEQGSNTMLYVAGGVGVVALVGGGLWYSGCFSTADAPAAPQAADGDKQETSAAAAPTVGDAPAAPAAAGEGAGEAPAAGAAGEGAADAAAPEKKRLPDATKPQVMWPDHAKKGTDGAKIPKEVCDAAGGKLTDRDQKCEVSAGSGANVQPQVKTFWKGQKQGNDGRSAFFTDKVDATITNMMNCRENRTLIREGSPRSEETSEYSQCKAKVNAGSFSPADFIFRNKNNKKMIIIGTHSVHETARDAAAMGYDVNVIDTPAGVAQCCAAYGTCGEAIENVTRIDERAFVALAKDSVDFLLVMDVTADHLGATAGCSRDDGERQGLQKAIIAVLEHTKTTGIAKKIVFVNDNHGHKNVSFASSHSNQSVDKFFTDGTEVEPKKIFRCKEDKASCQWKKCKNCRQEIDEHYEGCWKVTGNTRGVEIEQFPKNQNGVVKQCARKCAAAKKDEKGPFEFFAVHPVKDTADMVACRCMKNKPKTKTFSRKHSFKKCTDECRVGKLDIFDGKAPERSCGGSYGNNNFMAVWSRSKAHFHRGGKKGKKGEEESEEEEEEDEEEEEEDEEEEEEEEEEGSKKKRRGRKGKKGKKAADAKA